MLFYLIKMKYPGDFKENIIKKSKYLVERNSIFTSILIETRYYNHDKGRMQSILKIAFNLLHILFQSKLLSEEKKQQLTENYGIKMTRSIETEVESMFDLSQGFVDQGRAEGIIHATISNIKNLMENANIDVDKALEMLKIADDLRPIVKEQLSQIM